MRLKVVQQKRAISLLGERDLERILGELLHLALYLLRDPSEEGVRRALLSAASLLKEPRGGELLGRAERVLKRALSVPEIKELFLLEGEDLREHPLFGNKKEFELLRPDRVVILPEKAVVIEYKLSGGTDEDRAQLYRYMDRLKKVLETEVEGRLVFLDPPRVELLKL